MTPRRSSRAPQCRVAAHSPPTMSVPEAVLYGELLVASKAQEVAHLMEHHYDPSQLCMVFHLDYDKQSDLDDSVGYWYAQPRGPSECRVYYSTDSQVPGWVPGFMKDQIVARHVQTGGRAAPPRCPWCRSAVCPATPGAPTAS